MSRKYQPLTEIVKHEAFFGDFTSITVTDFQEFAEAYQFTLGQVQLEIVDNYSDGCVVYFRGKRPATLEEREAHHKLWLEQEAAIRKHAREEKKLRDREIEIQERKELSRLQKKYGNKGS